MREEYMPEAPNYHWLKIQGCLSTEGSLGNYWVNMQNVDVVHQATFDNKVGFMLIWFRKVHLNAASVSMAVITEESIRMIEYYLNREAARQPSDLL